MHILQALLNEARMVFIAEHATVLVLKKADALFVAGMEKPPHILKTFKY